MIALLDHPLKRQVMGTRCRKKSINHYASAVVRSTEDYYAAAIAGN